MNDEPQKPTPAETHDGMLDSVRRARQRSLWRKEGEPSTLSFVGQIGVLGWIIVTPILVGLFIGRWIDSRLNSGIFWSAPLMLIGVGVGCWSAWRWMHRQ
ncbi:MAG: AtpZ/AtpI family protein [Methylovirgula sp.]